jgi:hypothetical protein
VMESIYPKFYAPKLIGRELIEGARNTR